MEVVCKSSHLANKQQSPILFSCLPERTGMRPVKMADLVDAHHRDRVAFSNATRFGRTSWFSLPASLFTNREIVQ